jgi:hypothetical protein
MPFVSLTGRFGNNLVSQHSLGPNLLRFAVL